MIGDPSSSKRRRMLHIVADLFGRPDLFKDLISCQAKNHCQFPKCDCDKTGSNYEKTNPS